jgi:DNA-binding transcriptional ArsR family regulator
MVKRKGPSGRGGGVAKSSVLPPEASYTLSNLDQVKVLADPLRLRILKTLCEGEHTTKQVAELLGEKPNKLYHHVDALERVGLIKLSRTRQNRGTLEKYYLAVARSFRTDSRLFTTGDKVGGEETATLHQMMATIFDTTAAELARLIDMESATKAGDASSTKTLEEEALVSFLEIRGSKKELDEIRDKLQTLIKSITAEGEAPDGPERYRLTLAYYPVIE